MQISIAALMLLCSCSWTFMTPPVRHEFLGPSPPKACTQSVVAPTLDAVMAAIFGVGGIAAFFVGAPNVPRGPIKDGRLVALGAGSFLGLGLPFLASSLVGFSNAQKCTEEVSGGEDTSRLGFERVDHTPDFQ